MVPAASAYVCVQFPERWFRRWTFAYTASWLALALDFFCEFHGRSGLLAEVEIFAISLSVVLMVQVARLMAGRPATRRGLALGSLALALPGVAWLLGGGSFNGAVTLTPAMIVASPPGAAA